MTIRLALAALLFATGCHAKFKKHVGDINHVKPDIVVSAGPHVRLGGTGGTSLVDAAINLGQAVRSGDLTRRVGDAVNPADVGDAFVHELDAAVGKRPFELRDKSRTTLQLELVDYGVDVAGLGAQGALTYTIVSRIYLPKGERVYSATHRCAVSFSDPDVASVVFQTVNNAKAIKDMSDNEIRDMFDGGARYCAQQTAMRIRKHGG